MSEQQDLDRLLMLATAKKDGDTLRALTRALIRAGHADPGQQNQLHRALDVAREFKGIELNQWQPDKWRSAGDPSGLFVTLGPYTLKIAACPITPYDRYGNPRFYVWLYWHRGRHDQRSWGSRHSAQTDPEVCADLLTLALITARSDAPHRLNPLHIEHAEAFLNVARRGGTFTPEILARTPQAITGPGEGVGA